MKFSSQFSCDNKKTHFVLRMQIHKLFMGTCGFQRVGEDSCSSAHHCLSEHCHHDDEASEGQRAASHQLLTREQTQHLIKTMAST